jgi:hypothetical protein
MRSIFKIYIGSFCIPLILLGLLTFITADAVVAKVAIITETVSGKITHVGRGNTITLDGQKIYYPVRPSGQELQNIGLNSTVTVEYYTQGDKKIYMRVAPGRNSIISQHPELNHNTRLPGLK